MRLKPKPFAALGLHAMPDGATCLAAAPAAASAGASASPLVAAGCYEDEVALLEAPGLTLVASLPGHAGGTNALAFAGPALLVSAGEDGTAALWDCGARRLRARLACEGVDADRYVAGDQSAVAWLGLAHGCSSRVPPRQRQRPLRHRSRPLLKPQLGHGSNGAQTHGCAGQLT
jgi:hypothetical protein